MVDESVKKKGVNWPMLVVGAIIISALVALCIPLAYHRGALPRAATALNKAKDIYVGLREYSFKYGSLPPALEDANTSLAVVFEEGMIEDEKPFFVKGSEHLLQATEGDGNISSGEILEGHTNSFSYWTKANNEGVNIRTANANTPLLSTPMLKNGGSIGYGYQVYDRSSFGAQAIVCTADGAAMVYSLDEKGMIQKEATEKTDVYPSKKFHPVFPTGCIRKDF